MDVITEVKKLNFPVNEYVVIGGAALAARGIRETDDLDIAVTPALFEKCKREGWEVMPWTKPGKMNSEWLKKDKAELFQEVIMTGDNLRFTDLSKDIEIVNGVPCLSLARMAELKREYLSLYGRTKDTDDLALINKITSEEEPIHLEEYNPIWPGKFLAERGLVAEALGDWVVGGIEHVGSTAVPGLTAKPIIDMMVGVKNLKEAKVCLPMLGKIGYVYSPYRTEIMHWFCKPSFSHRDFHLYLMEYNGPEWKKRVAFRDCLRTNPEIAQEYVKLKTGLASKFKNDREAYTNGKAEFIERICKL